ncbi:MAG: succinate dehydrogenase/fumarate reductase iron-sulfur subunit [Gammaproteobacteria bacterium]|jgi:succinate dehydrogenase / fumarate reductase iron-sulfur subunit|nr:succinate dehydrogenase/fumarate reductase iron-sulfur subunit [Gammaproteobacteria bacterium]MBT4608141.1 succinate dehydrogenase/fumarate reductase iron-sulfur subunit [Thiotrichales bacterium]MBT3471911.1 succinate dehydrogenase/fumarate reductase iron-sulfur subunit [Gammaproteobacteria bacterium]MBT3966667.1 succinate dehydrogenase/fumarate reductase iron-sulfur subunit [Gammaproteobacteria bacterium]MBT4081886.1 succinate dehydrogenase/fumarate reductase iron-sulfur subunit [Gammaprote
MRFNLRVWRQLNQASEGEFESYSIDRIGADLSFLEMIDHLNEALIEQKIRPIAFDHDCREGICGACSLIIDGVPHGPMGATTTCQLYMRHFEDGAEITIEPWRAGPFPVIQDLVVDRSPFERILQAGGYVSVHTGEAPDANVLLVSKEVAERAFEAANCIGCGACVTACPNASAMLFVAAKVTHLALLPQGQPERERRVVKMVEAMDAEGFGNCSNHYACADACPKQIPLSLIARLNREFLQSALLGREFGEDDLDCCHQE